MRFTPTAIDGVTIVDLEPHADDRGFFARAFCVEEFAHAGLAMAAPQINLSRNAKAFTLRGLHYRVGDDAEAKVVRVTRGRLFDVAVDVRPESLTFRRWIGVELDAQSGRALHIGEGVAHGFLTLEDETDILYVMSKPHAPAAERGLRWNDPAFAIAWPAAPQVISERDAGHPDFIAA